MPLLPAVILGSHANALTFARSLGRQGVPVWLADSENALGRYSRYATVISLPDVEQDPGAWLKALTALGKRLGTCVLFSTTDAHCLWLAAHKTQLEPYFRFLSLELQDTERLVFKDKQYAAACAAAIPTPRTFLPASADDLQAIAPHLTYPCILKPTVAHRGRKSLQGNKVCLVTSAQDLYRNYTRLASDDTPFFVQEIVPGGDDNIFVYLALWDTTAQERAFVTLQKLRQYPPNFGSGSLFQTVAQPRIVTYARRLLHELHYVGLVEVEFKYDARADEFYLIEVNPRAGTMAEVAAAAGIDLGWLAYRYLSNGCLPNGAPFRAGVRVVDEEIDLLAFLALKHELSAREWLQSLRGARPLIAAWDDPLPLLMGVGRGIRRLLNKQ